ncbi:hypothetical protein [Nostoc sp. CHAB 5715]|uniref:hypothetical protein n=1 Tax=Nostoc sp. CHAB 5715 TaxID=2780400 RepID=UPI001E4A6152|nr:hypothetical protein [Nostoc sp. CHAB 5715]MCC5625636.1 hypothetical protein [Nostoc sp. CHAB 5715]
MSFVICHLSFVICHWALINNSSSPAPSSPSSPSSSPARTAPSQYFSVKPKIR